MSEILQPTISKVTELSSLRVHGTHSGTTMLTCGTSCSPEQLRKNTDSIANITNESSVQFSNLLFLDHSLLLLPSPSPKITQLFISLVIYVLDNSQARPITVKH